LTESIIYADFANTEMVDLKIHTDPYNRSASTLELVVHDRKGGFRTMKFEGVTNLAIEKGFTGYLGGMEIIDISSRQWTDALIEVRSFESDPSISFLATNIEVSCGFDDNT